MVKRSGHGQAAGGDSSAVLLASPVRRAIMESLDRRAVPETAATQEPEAGGVTAAQLAEELGLHVTTVRFHLDQLEVAGLVESSFTRAFGVGRPRKVYSLGAKGKPDTAASHLQLLAGLLSASFGSDVTPQEAGEQWVHDHVHLEKTAPAATPGAWLTKIGRLIDVLQRWGYTPDLSTTEGGRSCRIDLVSCPFTELARANQEVVCGIHRGLLSGALGQMGEERVEVSLQPFVGPSLCHAHISTRQPFENPDEESPDEP